MRGTWREDGGAGVSTHMIWGLRWYMRKKLEKLCLPPREQCVDGKIMEIVSAPGITPSDEDDEERLALIKKIAKHRKSDVFDALILFMRYECGMTIKDIANQFGRSKKITKEWLDEAEDCAREILTDVKHDE